MSSRTRLLSAGLPDDDDVMIMYVQYVCMYVICDDLPDDDVRKDRAMIQQGELFVEQFSLMIQYM